MTFLRIQGILTLMILKKEGSENKLFYVVTANWESCVDAKSAEEAAAMAMENAYAKYGKNLCLSTTVSVLSLPDILESFDPVEYTELLFTPEVLANAGLHELSKNFKKIINNAADLDEDM